MAKIFISYRREDSEWPAHKLREALAPHLASPSDLFMDIHSIPLGVNFEDYISSMVAQCDMLLAVIGPRWLDILHAREGQGPDYVRTEIAAALERNIPVVPVLIAPARVPLAESLPDDLKPLAKRNAPPAISAARFDEDIQHLIRGLGLAAPAPAPAPPQPEPSRSDGVPGLAPSQFNEADYVFVSHPKDIDPVLMRAIVRTIIADGHSVWLYDPVGLGFRVDELVHMRWQLAGGAWEGQTLDALRKASCVLLLVSRTSLQKGFQAQEIKQAATRTGVVTILVDDLDSKSLPKPIAGRFARRITAADIDSGLGEKLLAVLSRDIATASYEAEGVQGAPVREVSPRRKTGLFIAGGLVAAAAALGVFAWVDPLDLIPDAARTEPTASVVIPHPVPMPAPESEPESDAAPVDTADPSATALPASDSSATDAARAEAIRDLQRALSGIGLYTSGIDGAAGPGTRAAASRFASETGGSAPDLETAAPGEIAAFTARVAAEATRRAERESAAWDIARRTDTIAAYRAYLTDYPSGANVSSANSRIRTLEREAALQAESAAWSRAQSTNTLAAYQAYLRDYPSGANVSAARSRIASLTPPPEPQYRTGQTFRDTLSGGGRGPEMVVVPSGAFRMGSPDSEVGRGSDEGPQRTVRIDYQFAVGKYEVTWAEWEACVADGGCSNSGPDSRNGDEDWGKGARPVINVNWEDAQAYLRWLSRKTGERYRLLSEAEWEYVARAGTTGRFSNDGSEAELCQIANGDDTTTNFFRPSIACSDGYGKQTAPVGSFASNPFGLHDVHGNVGEWTQDCYVDSYSGAPTDGAARSVSDCLLRVLRGGSWRRDPRDLRSASRSRLDPQYLDPMPSTGFRVARTL